jgi:hypothetical protein
MNGYDDIIDKSSKEHKWNKTIFDTDKLFSNFQENVHLALLLKYLKGFEIEKSIIISLTSIEYINLTIIWLNQLHITKNQQQYIVFCCDKESYEELLKLNYNVACIKLPSVSQNRKYTSNTGFSKKGLLITSQKFQIVEFLLNKGFNVQLADIDALYLKKINEKLFIDIDIAFQRVIYFPKAIADEWGFTACSGYVFFRSNEKTISLIKNAINYQKEVYSDQIALNLAIFKEEIEWDEFNINKEDLVCFFKNI